MNPYELPTTIEVDGKEYKIRTDFRAVLDVLISQKDPDLDDGLKTMIMLKIMLPDWRKLKPGQIVPALKAISEFIDCGYEDDGKPKPQLVDWQQDAKLIIPAVNNVAHTEVRQLQYMHWWTFFSYYMEIGESLFSNVVSIRAKKAKNKKLEKYEREFYQENKNLIDIKHPLSEQEAQAKDSLMAWLDGKEVKQEDGSEI